MPGRYIVAVKVIDILGNETITLMPVDVNCSTPIRPELPSGREYVERITLNCRHGLFKLDGDGDSELDTDRCVKVNVLRRSADRNHE